MYNYILLIFQFRVMGGLELIPAVIQQAALYTWDGSQGLHGEIINIKVQ